MSAIVSFSSLLNFYHNRRIVTQLFLKYLVRKILYFFTITIFKDDFCTTKAFVSGTTEREFILLILFYKYTYLFNSSILLFNCKMISTPAKLTPNLFWSVKHIYRLISFVSITLFLPLVLDGFISPPFILS